MTETPTDPGELRAEIAATRADLGQTIEALSAKTDVKARAKGAASDAVEQTKEKVRAVRVEAGQVAANVGDRVRSGTTSVRDSVTDVDVPAAVRKSTFPAAAIALAAAIVGVIMHLVRRRRS
jgi:Protein of unknown function (DUF3618)